MPFVTTADACDREAAWLTTTGDGLPALLVSAGGPWDLIQAYEPRTPAQRKNQIWVIRSEFDISILANQRSQPTYAFDLRLHWTLSSGAGSAETDQRAFDAAINALVTRILGQPPTGNPPMDKTHNGAFQSVAETRRRVAVRYVEPAATMTSAAFSAVCSYSADDWEFNN